MYLKTEVVTYIYIVLLNCSEKLLVPTIFFNLKTTSSQNFGSKSRWSKRDLNPTWNLDIKS